MYLLDTNVISELRTARADPNVAEWSAAQSPSSLFLSVIVILELEIGILRKQRRDPAQAAALRYWLNNRVLPEFSNRLLDINKDVALQCAHLHVPNTRSERDALIAATALGHGMTVVTRNTADFAPMHIPLLNPWTPAA